jgi:hypothetical protein
MLCAETIDSVKETIDTMIECGCKNEQWFLDFLDDLNELSTSW